MSYLSPFHKHLSINIQLQNPTKSSLKTRKFHNFAHISQGECTHYYHTLNSHRKASASASLSLSLSPPNIYLIQMSSSPQPLNSSLTRPPISPSSYAFLKFSSFCPPSLSHTRKNNNITSMPFVNFTI